MFAENISEFVKMSLSHGSAKNSRKKCQKCDKRKYCVGDVKNTNKTVFKNVNSAFFAMLMQKTTFTIVLIISTILINTGSFVSALEIEKTNNASKIEIVYPVFERVEENAIEGSSAKNIEESTTLKVMEINPSTPVYIPLDEKEIKESIEGVESTSIYKNDSFQTGNTLWDGLLNECSEKPSVSCIQKNVFTFLDDSLGMSGDVNVTEGFRFKRNKLAHWKYTEEANKVKKNKEKNIEDNSVNVDDDDDEQEEGRFADSPIEEVTGALYGKGVSFMMSHDLELKLPETMFDGATLRLQPRGLEGSGALMKVELIPRELENHNGEGRIFFKKIKKFIKNKVLLAILAIVVIVKLVKLKLFIFLPLLLGVHNAKKLFLKFVLFIFPALSNIFKLCSWYHSNYHGTKHHHHHHQISHLHHPVPHVPTHVYGPPSHGPTQVEFHGPPGYAPPTASHHHHSLHQLENQDWTLSGPGLGPEYLSADIHRNAVGGTAPSSFSPRPEDAADISSWGLSPPGPGAGSSSYAPAQPYQASAHGVTAPSLQQRLPQFEDQRFVRESMYRKVMGTPQGPPLQMIRKPNQVINPLAEKEALLRAAQRQALSQTEEVIRQSQLKQVIQQQKVLQAAYSAVDPQYQSTETQFLASAAPVYDSFYSPILQRVDQVMETLVVHEEPCRERLVCEMYREPQRFSPHSNIVSNELSREASELQKPAAGSTAALRFYRYVQAARDGQEKKDCSRMYSFCGQDLEKRFKRKKK